MTAENFCIDFAKPLIPFYEEVMGYKFEEEPNYSKLKFLLKRILLN
jgi:hypothetical protein